MTTETRNNETNLDFSERPVPPEGKMPKGNLMMAWWAVCSAIFYLVVAAAMARAYGALNALIGIVLTVIAYGIINAIISRFSIKTGLTVALFSRMLFGRVGAVVAALIFCATATYYAVFEGYVMALALSDWANIPMLGASAIVVVFGVVLIFGSIQHWLDKFNGVLLPIYVIGMLVTVGIAVATFGYPSGWLTSVPEGGASSWGWLHTFTYYMGVWILMMYTFDYARFGREEDTIFHTRVSFGIPFYMMTFLFSGIVGILLDSMIPTNGLSEASIVLGMIDMMGVFAVILVWITQARINTANYYLATVNLESIVGTVAGIKPHKILTAVIIGVIAYILMTVDVFSYLLLALAYQGVFVVAWVGVALSHILSPTYRHRFKDHVEFNGGRLPAVNPCGLIAWLLGASVGIVLMHVPNGGILSAPLTFVVASACYLIGLRYARAAWYGAAGEGV